MSRRSPSLIDRRIRRGLSSVVAAATLMFASIASGADATWDGDSLVGTQGDGRNWSDANNWTAGGIDDAAPADVGPGDDLLFGGGSVGVIQLATNRFANSLSFSAGFTLDAAGSVDVLNIATGDIAILEDQKPVILNAILNSSNGLTITGSDAQSTVIMHGDNLYTGNTSASDCTVEAQSDSSLGNPANGVMLNDADLVALSSFNTARNITCGGQTATLTVTTGLKLTVTGSISSTGETILTGGGTLELSGASTLNNLNVSSGKVVFEPTTRSAITLGGLTLTGSTLDLTDADMIVHNGAIGAIQASLTSGFNYGNWNGPGIVSSVAASNTSHITTLGYLLNNTGSNQPILSTFDGQTVSDTDVLVKYTYVGDTNLDGKVDGTDYSRIDSAYVLDRTNPTAATGWYNGDFNYDGVINGSDYTLIDNAFNSQGASLAVSIASPLASIATHASTVPEPCCMAVLVAMGLGRRKVRWQPNNLVEGQFN